MKNYLTSVTVVVFLTFAFTIGTTYRADKADAIRGMAGCERTKLDRKVIAKVLRGHDAYLINVVDAPSVREDVKRGARAFQALLSGAGDDLISRTDVPCDELYEKPSILGFRP